MKALSVKIISHFDEDGEEWIKLKTYIGKSGTVKDEGLTYFLATMPDGEEIFAPKECVTVTTVQPVFSTSLALNPEE